MRARLRAGLALVLVLVVAGAALLAVGVSSRADLPTLQTPAGPSTITARIADQTVGQPIRPGFLGLSIEFQAVRAYTGANPGRINPVLVQLIRNITPAQAPVLRIGGDSTDVSFAPAAGLKPPPYLSYKLSRSWMASTAALARALGAQMIMGLNLGANQPALAAAEARAFLRAFGSGAVSAFEIGNEPNVYDKIAIYRTPRGEPLAARAHGYGYPAFLREFRATAAASPRRTLVGPALATGPTPGPGSWVKTMPDFLRRESRVAVMSVHRYPLRNCFVPPSSPQYPTIGHLLDSYATVGLAKSLQRWIQIAHAHHRQLRVDELNSVACRGKPGVSDTFASSLWVVNALFQLARAGVDAVNMHTLPRSSYELFRFGRSGGRWHSFVKPVYYGLELFAQAAPPGSELLRVGGVKATGTMSVWATRSPDRRVRIVLVNKSPSRTETVTIRPPHGPVAGTTIEWLRARSVNSRSGLTLGGRSYGARTYTGTLALPRLELLAGRAGGYKIAMPHASAALITLGG